VDRVPCQVGLKYNRLFRMHTKLRSALKKLDPDPDPGSQNVVDPTDPDPDRKHWKLPTLSCLYTIKHFTNFSVFTSGFQKNFLFQC